MNQPPKLKHHTLINVPTKKMSRLHFKLSKMVQRGFEPRTTSYNHTMFNQYTNSHFMNTFAQKTFKKTRISFARGTSVENTQNRTEPHYAERNGGTRSGHRFRDRGDRTLTCILRQNILWCLKILRGGNFSPCRNIVKFKVVFHGFVQGSQWWSQICLWSCRFPFRPWSRIFEESRGNLKDSLSPKFSTSQNSNFG